MRRLGLAAGLPLLLAALAGLLPAQPSAAGSVSCTVLARHEQGVLVRAGSQRVLCLKGSPREIGRQHGKLLAAEVATVVAETLAWTQTQGLSRAQLEDLARSAAPFLPQRYVDEMQGLAEGAGIAFDDVRLVHMMPSKFHCTGAAAARRATRDGKVYHLRSLDYALDIGVDSRLQEHALLIVREDEDGIPSVVPSWAGVLGAVSGMNGAGISVGEMGSQCRDEDQRGMPMIFLVREVLRRATTLAQAVAIFRDGPATCGYHFVVGSGDERDAAAIEVARSHFALFGLGDDKENVAPHTAMPDVVRRANHFVDPQLAATQRDPYDPRQSAANSWQAYARMTEFLQQRHGSLDGDALIELLRLYPKAHGCLHQAVFCPSDRRLWVAQAKDERKTAFAGAQNQDFYGYELSALLARDWSRPVAVRSANQAPPVTSRTVVVRHGERECRYEIEDVQGDRTSRVLAAEPSDPQAFPRVEVHAPIANDEHAPGVVLFSSGEPALIASRVLAQALASGGVATLVLPLRAGTPARVETLIDLAAGLSEILPANVERDRVAYVGLGLGAGSALQAALRSPRATDVVLAFTSVDLATRVAGDAATAKWLGIVSAPERARIGAELGGLLTDALLMERGARRALVLAARGEARLPAPEQEELAKQLGGAELWWHDGSVRSLQKDATAAARKIASFLAR